MELKVNVDENDEQLVVVVVVVYFDLNLTLGLKKQLIVILNEMLPMQQPPNKIS